MRKIFAGISAAVLAATIGIYTVALAQPFVDGPAILSIKMGGTGVDGRSVAAYSFLGNNTGSSGPASFSTLPAAALPATAVLTDTIQTITGVKTMSGANVITHAPTGLIVQDSDATHAVTIAPGNESGNRTLSIPVLGGADTVATLGTTQTFAGAKTFTLAPVLTSATLSANGDTITIQDLGNANLVQSEGAQTINGVKTFGSAPVLSTATLTANGDTITIQDLGNANIVQTEGTQTINGTKTFGTPLGGVSINNAVRRQRLTYYFNNGATLADATTYATLIPIGRACTVTGVFPVAIQPTVGGTNTLKVLKASSGGATMLDAATLDPTVLVANTVKTDVGLTAVGADLGLTAAQGVYVEYVTGTQTTDAVGAGITIEYVVTDL